eukprot:TRINITY_DN5849_c0_g2_i6.p1 TRINITY_DN5849_c0_g2~~TRINITY_DN5849_c0_g2_i6.p1  ORF type:complete len:202 (+),score=76.28 TRINITY_DN5849_c0_g2_i6:95-700(+)
MVHSHLTSRENVGSLFQWPIHVIRNPYTNSPSHPKSPSLNQSVDCKEFMEGGEGYRKEHEKEWRKCAQKKWSEIIAWSKDNQVSVSRELIKSFIDVLRHEGDEEMLEEFREEWESFKSAKEERIEERLSTEDQAVAQWKRSLITELDQLVMIGRRFSLDFAEEIRILKARVMRGREKDLKAIEELVVKRWEEIYDEVTREE